MKRDHDDVMRPEPSPRSQPWGPDWTSRGVIRVLEPLVLPRRQERIQSVLKSRLASVVVVMDAPHDPHNGAAVMRSCDAFGVQELHVVLRHEPFLVSRAVTQGTERWVDLALHQTPEGAVEQLVGAGYEIVSTHPEGELLPDDLATIPRLALLLGNEHDGIREALARAARRSVRIPMRGFVESLNVSVSAAILLHAATRQRAGDLDPERRLAFYAAGLYHSLPRAGEILSASSPE